MTTHVLKQSRIGAIAAPNKAVTRWIAVILAFALGYAVASAPEPDFSDRHIRAAGPDVPVWHGNVRQSGQ